MVRVRLIRRGDNITPGHDLKYKITESTDGRVIDFFIRDGKVRENCLRNLAGAY